MTCALIAVVYNLIALYIKYAVAVRGTVTIVVAPPPAARSGAENILVDAIAVGKATGEMCVTRHNLCLSKLCHHSKYGLYILALAHML